jgi:hypothetical protein
LHEAICIAFGVSSEGFFFECKESELKMDPHEWLVNAISDAEKYCNLNDLEATGLALKEALLVLRAELAVLAQEKPPLLKRESRLHLLPKAHWVDGLHTEE